MAAGRQGARLQPDLVLLRLRVREAARASEQVNYELGQGLPGLAWAKGQPLQLDDIRDSFRFDRAAAALQAGPEALADFNGDGIDDLVVGVPGETGDQFAAALSA